MAAKSSARPSVVVIYGEEEFQRSERLREALDALLPPPVDRSLALADYDGEASEELGGPTLARVMDDLRTLPFLAEVRVVLIRSADRFISAARERLEAYAESPARTGVLVLCCRSFPKTTRLYKKLSAGGGQLIECKKLTQRGLRDFALAEAQRLGKRLAPEAADQLLDAVGPQQGLIALEIEKLSLYVGERKGIESQDVSALIGQTREERIFAVLDSAALGDVRGALEQWQQVLATDAAAPFRAVGGVALVLRRWLAAQDALQAGEPIRAIAPRLMMWGRERELERILQRLPPPVLRRLLASVADLDAQAKVGARSIEAGIEEILLAAASPGD